MKEKIFDSIQDMDARELHMLYGQIRLMKMLKSAKSNKKRAMPIEKIHAMTSSSQSSWADTLVQDREDRL